MRSVTITEIPALKTHTHVSFRGKENWSCVTEISSQNMPLISMDGWFREYDVFQINELSSATQRREMFHWRM